MEEQWFYAHVTNALTGVTRTQGIKAQSPQHAVRKLGGRRWFIDLLLTEDEFKVVISDQATL